MSSLSQALRLEDLPSSHSAFQGHAAHIIEWPIMLRPKDSEGTCIPSGVTTFLQAASRRSPSADSSGSSVTLGLAPRRPSRTFLLPYVIAWGRWPVRSVLRVHDPLSCPR